MSGEACSLLRTQADSETAMQAFFMMNLTVAHNLGNADSKPDVRSTIRRKLQGVPHKRIQTQLPR